jgi:hypothetical protein
MRKLIALVSVLAAIFMSGCGPRWVVLSQAQPNPFVGKTEFAVLPIDFSGLMVGEKTEEQYLSEKTDEQRASFEADKVAMVQKFEAAMRAYASGDGVHVATASGEVKAPFIIKPHVTFIEPGFYAVVASGSSQVTMRVRIETTQGQLLDEIELTHGTNSANGSSIGGISLNPSSGGRLRDDAEEIGDAMGEYLTTRVIPGE